MVQPLNDSASKVNFTGKTVNNHPELRNTPLRLNEQERNNPNLVLLEFFLCYHLNDVREIIYGWMVTVVSSPASISADPHERNNHIFFYEKIEQLVEACWLLQTKDQ
ncbi:hypothetical protein A3860_25975 [Niastella vici]|uniref:Uncharacterized protein n=1 Tax=Niastella vici TaxID=1703345 RepID=A0A1V9FX00_9BACT|nr:hypothetical protein [Niastella vici]OQP62766.1 hypothetical protein A3860_25975 [Niastella vici]